MFGFKKKFVDVKILDFKPLTDNDKTIERKKALLDEIRQQIDVEKVKKDCEKKIIGTSCKIIILFF